MRVIQERRRRQLRRMNERGSEAHKVERTRTLIRNLSTKIRIAINFVDSVSTKINKLRDEELWPQIVELLQGYAVYFSFSSNFSFIFSPSYVL